MGPVVLAIGLLVLIGAGVTTPFPAFEPGLDRIDLAILTCGLWLIAGAATLMAAGSTLAVLGVRLPVGVVALLLATSVGLRVRGRRRRGGAARRGRRLRGPAARRGTARRRLSAQPAAKLVLCGAALAASALWLRACALHPNQTWDSIVIWGTRSRALHFARGLDSPIFTSPSFRYLHQDYPLGVPVLESLVADLGEPVSRGAIGLLGALPLGAAAVLYGALRQRHPAPLAAGAAVIFLGLPLLVSNVSSGLADGIVATFLLVVTAALWRWIEDGSPAWLYVAAAAGTGLVLTKDEGSALLAAVAIAALAAVAAGAWRDRRLRPVVLVALVPAAALAPWQLWVHLHHIPTSFLGGGAWRHIPGHVGGMGRIVRAGAGYAVDPRRYALLWPVAVGLGLWRLIRRGPEQAFFVSAFVLGALVFVVVDGLDASYLISTALARNMIGLSAILVVWVAASVGASRRPSVSSAARTTADRG